MTAETVDRNRAAMSRPCSGRGRAPSAAASSDECFARAPLAPARRAGTPPRGRPAAAARQSRAPRRSRAYRGWCPGRRNSSQGARAAAAAALAAARAGRRSTRRLQPAMSATVAVSSCEPPSATITSLIRPAMAPGTSAASVRTSERSESRVGNDDAQHSLPDRAGGLVEFQRGDLRRSPKVSNVFHAAHAKLFLFCSLRGVSFGSTMTRSSVLRRPPAPLPSVPAGEMGTAVDRERRRGRGTAFERDSGATSRSRASPSTTAGRAWRNCRRSRPA